MSHICYCANRKPVNIYNVINWFKKKLRLYQINEQKIGRRYAIRNEIGK